MLKSLFKTSKFRFLFLIGMLTLWASLTFSSALTEISFFVAMIAALTFFIPDGMIESWYKEQSKTSIFVLLFFFLCCISFFWSENKALSARGILKVLQHFVIFVFAAHCFREPKHRALFWKVFIGMAAILCLDGAYQYFTGVDFIRGFKGEEASAGFRLSASFKSYGLFAAYLILTIPTLGAIALNAWQAKSRWRYAYILLFLASGLMLFLTRSRGPILSIGIVTFLFLILTKRFKVLIALSLIGMIGLLFLPRSMIIHIDKHGKEQSIVERYYLWDRAMHVIKAKPLTGTGINTYAETHDKYDQTKSWRVKRYYAHNGYLQLAAETGLITLLLLLGFLVFYFINVIRRVKKNSSQVDNNLTLGILLGIANFLVLILVDTVFHNPQPVMLFWYMVGLGWGESKQLESNA